MVEQKGPLGGLLPHRKQSLPEASIKSCYMTLLTHLLMGELPEQTGFYHNQLLIHTHNLTPDSI